jgi:hypothetical protein
VKKPSVWTPIKGQGNISRECFWRARQSLEPLHAMRTKEGFPMLEVISWQASSRDFRKSEPTKGILSEIVFKAASRSGSYLPALRRGMAVN